MIAVLALLSCSDHRPEPVPADRAAVIRLEDLPLATYQVPPDSRPGHAPAPTQIPVEGPWHRDTEGGRSGWTAPLPIRPRGLFFFKPEPEMRLVDTTRDPEHANLPFTNGWTHDRDSISLWSSELKEAPAKGRFVLVYPTANEREDALNRKSSGLDDHTFAWTTIQDGWDARRGLLLPAPGVAEWELDVPVAGELSFTSGLVEPEIRDAPDSDGARLTVTVEADGATVDVWSGPLAPRSFQPHRVDLSTWAGRHVRLRMTTDPVGDPTFDYAFVAEPTIASRLEDPVRVVMVFIDTLRVDHTSLYGYSRDTTAPIDALAPTSAVFQNAYSVAPWTLPSAQAIVTGRQPEEYKSADPLPAILGRVGFATAFFAGNVYLSSNFDLQRGWDLHRLGGIFPAGQQPTDDALQWLEDHDGRNALVQVHYMDAHLPYHEPGSYRRQYAGDADPKLGEKFELADVRRANVGEDEDAQQYIQDRYDNNIRYIADQVERLIETLDDNDILLVYADHGEEFWDHGKYEHGHALFNELVHVPLMIHAPGLPAGRIEEPVSLLDLAPTILELVGQPVPAEMDGRSLVALVHGDPEAKTRFAARDLAFGRPLYGPEQWGVLHQGDKWTTTEGREALYELTADPGEQKNLMIGAPGDRGAPYRDALGTALERPVRPGYRLTPSNFKGPPTQDTLAICTVPGGFQAVWGGGDPLNLTMAVPKSLDAAEAAARLAQIQVTDHPVGPDDAGVEICWPRGFAGGREVYLVPTRPLAEVGGQMSCSAFLGTKAGGKRATMQIPPTRDPDLAATRIPLNRIAWDQRQLLWQYGIGPEPVAGEEISGVDPESEGMLVKLGYAQRDGTPTPEGERREAPRPCEIPEVPLTPMPPRPEK